MSADASGEFSDVSDGDAPTPLIHVRARPPTGASSTLTVLVADVSAALAEMQAQPASSSSLLDLVDFSEDTMGGDAPPRSDTPPTLPLALPSDDASHAAHSPAAHGAAGHVDSADVSALLPADVARDVRDALAIVTGEYARGSGSTGVRCGGPPLPLDHLGPIVLNSDGTTSRITNWADMSEPERARTAAVIARRNEKRRTALRDAAHDAVSTGGASP